MNLFDKRPLFCALTSFIVTAFFSSLLFYRRSALFICVFILSLFVIISLFYLLSKRKRKGKIRGKEITAFCCIFLAFLACFSQLFFVCTRLTVPERFLNEEIEIKATVKEIIYEGDGYTLLTAKVGSLNGEKANIKLKFELYSEETFHVGDIFSCNEKIYDIYSLSRYDASLLFEEGCAGEVSNVSDLTKIGEKNTPLVWVSRLGDFITNRIESNLTGDSGPLISALLLGRTKSLDPHITLDFKRLGITHMLALSGMHLTMLMSFVGIMLSRVNLKKKTKSFIILALTLFYITLSGFCLSILRAAFMFLFATLSFFSRRENDSFTSLFLSVTLIFLITPNAVADIGLWLSFFGTMGILSYLQLEAEKSIEKNKSLFQSVLSYLTASFTISIFAIMFTLPISVFIFGELSLISPISNVIFAFLFDLLLVLAFLSPFLFGIRIFSLVCEFLGNIIVGLSNFISGFDMIFVSVSYIPFYVALSLFLVCLALILCVKMKRKTIIKSVLSSFAMLMLTLFICLFVNFKDDTFIYQRGDDYQRNEFLFFTNDAKTTIFDVTKENKKSFSEMLARCENERISEISSYVISRYNDSLLINLDKASATIKIKHILLPEPTCAESLNIANSVTKRLDELRIPYDFYKFNEVVSLDNLEFKLIDGHIIDVTSRQKTFSYVSSYAFICDYLPLRQGLDYLILGHQDGVFTVYFKMPDGVKNLIIADSDNVYNDNFINDASMPENVFMDKSVEFIIE